MRSGVEVTLLHDHPTLFYSGMVPEYLGGVYAPNEVQIDLVRWCERAGVTFRQGRAIALTPQARTVTIATGATFGYDVAVFENLFPTFAMSASKKGVV